MKENLLSDIDFAKDVLLLEAEAIKKLVNRLDFTFQKAVDLIFYCKGRVVVTGIGKAGIIGQKISATLASTGTPSYWIHSLRQDMATLDVLFRMMSFWCFRIAAKLKLLPSCPL